MVKIPSHSWPGRRRCSSTGSNIRTFHQGNIHIDLLGSLRWRRILQYAAAAVQVAYDHRYIHPECLLHFMIGSARSACFQESMFEANRRTGLKAISVSQLHGNCRQEALHVHRQQGTPQESPCQGFFKSFLTDVIIRQYGLALMCSTNSNPCRVRFKAHHCMGKLPLAPVCFTCL